MRSFASLLFVVGLAFLLLILTGAFEFGNPPMRVGQAIQAVGAEETGAANLVTAVVLGYRGIDTLGELSILFAAATAGGFVLGRHRVNPKGAEAGFVLRTGADLLFPLLLVVGLYIVLHGHLTPGGGFQGGAILASAMLLLLLSNPARRFSHRLITLVESTAGISFVFIGILGILLAGGFLDNRILPTGTFGELFSAGAIPLIYTLVGLKVGAEFSSMLVSLSETEEL
jgi:multicomponent Na+:H+ antiporter subunit B